MGVKCFMVHATTKFRAKLRRFTWSSNSVCAGRANWGHDASSADVGIINGIKNADGYWDLDAHEKAHMPSREDPRWPAKCEACGYLFQPEDQWQLFTDHIYMDDTGKEYSLRAPVPGMMWLADWPGENERGPDGHTLFVICPDGGQWCIDGTASNCTKKDDVGPYGKAHRCWVRHGAPPLVTVDKAGLTCAAGAGSIMSSRGYHGFLRNGEFT